MAPKTAPPTSLCGEEQARRSLRIRTLKDIVAATIANSAVELGRHRRHAVAEYVAFAGETVDVVRVSRIKRAVRVWLCLCVLGIFRAIFCCVGVLAWMEVTVLRGSLLGMALALGALLVLAIIAILATVSILVASWMLITTIIILAFRIPTLRGLVSGPTTLETCCTYTALVVHWPAVGEIDVHEVVHFSCSNTEEDLV